MTTLSTHVLDQVLGQRSTIVTSQMPVDNWHELIGDPIRLWPTPSSTAWCTTLIGSI